MIDPTVIKFSPCCVGSFPGVATHAREGRLVLCADTTLAEFDRTMAELSEWCEKNGEGATHLPRVNELLCVKGAEPGEWVRARVSRQVSER